MSTVAEPAPEQGSQQQKTPLHSPSHPHKSPTQDAPTRESFISDPPPAVESVTISEAAAKPQSPKPNPSTSSGQSAPEAPQDAAQSKQTGASSSTTNDNSITPTTAKKRKPRSTSKDSKNQPETQIVANQNKDHSNKKHQSTNQVILTNHQQKIHPLAAALPQSPKPNPSTSSGQSGPEAPQDAAQSKQTGASSSTTNDNSKTPTTAKKRKPRSTSNDSKNQPEKQIAAAPASAAPIASPPKRSRKKKTEPAKANDSSNINAPSSTLNAPTASTHHLSPFGVPMPPNSMMTNTLLSAQTPLSHLSQSNFNRQLPSLSPLDIQHASHDPTSRYFSLTISPYSNCDYTNAASLTRPSLSRLFTSSSPSSGPEIIPLHPPATTSLAPGPMSNPHHSSNHLLAPQAYVRQTDEIAKAFDDLRDNTWSHLSKCILEQAQQFDIPSLIGTLYTLRSENEKLVNKVRDLTMKREQLLAINARLDLPGPMLNQHLSHTSPNFSSVVAGITNSPKSLPNSSPSPAMNKSLGPPSFVDRNSPLMGVPGTHHAGSVSGLKSSSISTPSPPTGALLAHGANNRAGLMTVNNSPYFLTQNKLQSNCMHLDVD